MLQLYWDEAQYAEESAALRALSETQCETLIMGVDASRPAQAAVDALNARRNGTPFIAYCAAGDPLENMLAKVGAQIAANTNGEQRRTHLRALRDGQLVVGGVPFASSAPFPRETAIAANFIMQLADATAFFTDGEAARWSTLFGKPLRRISYLPVPPCKRAAKLAEGISVYAPSTTRANLGFVEASLHLHGHSVQTYITAENASEIPSTSIVIAPEWWRPARGLALACAGYRVVSPLRSAIAKRVRAFEYAELSPDSIAAAIDAAVSAEPGDVLWEPSDIKITVPAMPARPPLVSIVVRTFDRPMLLQRAIHSITQQTYPAIEVVVVNNGGRDVEELVRNACGRRALRYVRREQRATISTASNLGARAASGVYVGYLDDDDLLYPDHVALAVDALERSGADLAYTDCVGEYAVIESGRKSVLGIGIYLDREFNRDALYASNLAPIHSVVHRKDVFDRFGYFDESLPVTDDWELWLRVAHGGRFIHVGRPTCEYSWRIDPQRGNMTIRHQQDFVDCYKRITRRWAEQVANREDLRQIQAQMLALQEQRVAALGHDPSSAFSVLLEPLIQNAVPVRGLLDEDFPSA